MENGGIFLLFLVAWAFYVWGIHAYLADAKKTGVSQFAGFLSHSVPSFVAVSMILIFIVGGGGTVMQLSVGGLWLLWVKLFPLFLMLAVLGMFVQAVVFVQTFRGVADKLWRPVALAGIAMCVFTFFTVLSNFPSA